MAQQTAVEWLKKEIYARGPIANEMPDWLKELFEQAKSMEKEQIVVAYSNGSNDRLKNRINEQYYNETYGS